jgi:uncharacterized membrane protein HdeD (DUF308 family)
VKSFIDKTIVPFLIVAGLGTCSAGILFILPQFAVETFFKLPFTENYTIFIQHWGLMVFLAGIFLIVSAFKDNWRTPVLIYVAIEKTLYVSLYVCNINSSFSKGFMGGAIMDSLIVLYLILYFWKGES